MKYNQNDSLLMLLEVPYTSIPSHIYMKISRQLINLLIVQSRIAKHSNLQLVTIGQQRNIKHLYHNLMQIVFR